MGVECVAINGHASAEFVFISGTLYAYSGSQFKAQMTPEYFTNGSNNSQANFFASIAAGNFDENEVGREQLAFYIGEKEDAKDSFTEPYITNSAYWPAKTMQKTRSAQMARQAAITAHQ